MEPKIILSKQAGTDTANKDWTHENLKLSPVLTQDCTLNAFYIHIGFSWYCVKKVFSMYLHPTPNSWNSSVFTLFYLRPAPVLVYEMFWWNSVMWVHIYWVYRVNIYWKKKIFLACACVTMIISHNSILLYTVSFSKAKSDLKKKFDAEKHAQNSDKGRYMYLSSFRMLLHMYCQELIWR